MNTKHVLLAAGLGTLLLGSLSFAAVNSAKNKPDFAAVNSAVESNNYASLPDTAKAKITEVQFNEMVAKQAEHKSVEAAITAGDYTAFKNAMIAQIPTETEFQTMVTRHKEMSANKTAIETAVKNNDFAAFKTAMEAQRVKMEANRPAGADSDSPKAIDDTKLQEHFNKLVEYYKTNGKLPEMGGKGGFGGGPALGGTGPGMGKGFGGKGGPAFGEARHGGSRGEMR